MVLWLHRRQTNRGIRIPWFGLVLLGATAYTALQLVPLPIGLLGCIAPTTSEILKNSLAGVGGVRFHPISLDPGATAWEVLKLGTCTAVFLISHNHLRHRRDRTKILAAVAVAAVSLALVGLVGAAAAPGRPLMFYTPPAGKAIGLITTSFVNPNHGAAFLTMGLLLALGLASATRELQRRMLWTVAGVMAGTGVFLTLSRGGIASLAIGMATLGVLLTRRASAEPRRVLPRLTVTLVALAVIVGVAAWLAHDRIVLEFQHLIGESDSLNLGKIGLLPSATTMLAENPFVGVGRGAFMTTFPRYLEDSQFHGRTHSHLENQYLQLATEWGLIVAVIVIAASMFALIVWLRRGKGDPIMAAAGASLVALAAHNFVDFNLELLGLAVPAAAIAGILSASSPHSKKAESSSWFQARGMQCTPLALVLCGGIVISAGLLVSLWPPSAAEDERQLHSLSQSSPRPSALVKMASATIRRRPAGFVPHAVIAGMLARRGELREALRWHNRALYLHPHHPGLHIEAGHTLMRLSRTRRVLRQDVRRALPKQGMMQFRLAMEKGAAERKVLAFALPQCHTGEHLAVLLRNRPPMTVARAAQLLIKENRLSLAEGLVAQAIVRWPQHERVGAAQVRLLLATSKLTHALAVARKLVQQHHSLGSYLLLVTTTSRAQGPKEAIRAINEALVRYPEDLRLSFSLGRHLIKARKFNQASKIAESILRREEDPADRIKAHRLLALAHRTQNRLHSAKHHEDLAKEIHRKHHRSHGETE